MTGRIDMIIDTRLALCGILRYFVILYIGTALSFAKKISSEAYCDLVLCYD